MSEGSENEFHLFFRRTEPRLRRAFVAAYGSERGREAAAEALAYAWEHWGEIRNMENIAGYLYRVGQSRSRPRKARPFFVRPDDPEIWIEPMLAEGLAQMSEAQRTAVVLVHGFGWTLREVAECTGVAITTVQSHVDRGLKRLRASLRVGDHA